MYCHFLHGSFFLVLWPATAPTPTLSPEVGIRGVPAVRLTRGMLVGMSDARIQIACPGHGRQSRFRGKNELCDLISGGSIVLLCACLFADSGSLVPHVAAHMKCWQITSENLVHCWST